MFMSDPSTRDSYRCNGAEFCLTSRSTFIVKLFRGLWYTLVRDYIHPFRQLFAVRFCLICLRTKNPSNLFLIDYIERRDVHRCLCKDQSKDWIVASPVTGVHKCICPEKKKKKKRKENSHAHMSYREESL
jgi:hypothetical protein